MDSKCNVVQIFLFSAEQYELICTNWALLHYLWFYSSGISKILTWKSRINNILWIIKIMRDVLKSSVLDCPFNGFLLYKQHWVLAAYLSLFSVYDGFIKRESQQVSYMSWWLVSIYNKLCNYICVPRCFSTCLTKISPGRKINKKIIGVVCRSFLLPKN